MRAFVSFLLLCCIHQCVPTDYAFYLFLIINETEHEVRVIMNHEYSSPAYSQKGNDIINLVISPGNAIERRVDIDGVYELHKDLQKDGVVPIWDEYYIKEIIVNDTILDESKWRNEAFWEKLTFEDASYKVWYRLWITKDGASPNPPDSYQ